MSYHYAGSLGSFPRLPVPVVSPEMQKKLTEAAQAKRQTTRTAPKTALALRDMVVSKPKAPVATTIPTLPPGSVPSRGRTAPVLPAPKPSPTVVPAPTAPTEMATADKPFPWALAAGGVALLGLGLFFWMRRKK